MMEMFNKDLCVRLSYNWIVPHLLYVDKISVFKDKNGPFKFIHTGLAMRIELCKKSL